MQRGRTVLRRIYNRVNSGATILMYHRIADSVIDPWSMCISPDNFASQMDILRKHKIPCSLAELCKRLRTGKKIRNLVVITFDDGYADNLTAAVPILETHEIPATVFVVSDAIHARKPFWWDELESLFLAPGCIPGSINMLVCGRQLSFDFSDCASYGEQDCADNRNWRMNMSVTSDPTLRHAAYRQLYPLLQSLAESERENVMQRLREWADIEQRRVCVAETLTEDQFTQISGSEFISIGSHTVSHPLLNSLSSADQRYQIEHGRAELERRLGRCVEGFSYPHGGYTQNTVSMVRKAGFQYACCSNESQVMRDFDIHLLPRRVVEDWDPDCFRRWLSD